MTSHILQRGQAATEAVLVLSILAVLLAGCAYIGSNLAYVATTQQRARAAAFDVARGAPPMTARLDANVRTEAPVFRRQVMAWLEPGGAGAIAQTLRQQWRLADTGMLRSRVAQAHTDLLVGAGHADSDRGAQRRVGASDGAWGTAYRRSSALAGSVGARMARVDSGWKRASAGVDWLDRWADVVPTDVADAAAQRNRTRTNVRKP